MLMDELLGVLVEAVSNLPGVLLIPGAQAKAGDKQLKELELTHRIAGLYLMQAVYHCDQWCFEVESYVYGSH